jgi:hypothetical protein
MNMSTCQQIGLSASLWKSTCCGGSRQAKERKFQAKVRSRQVKERKFQAKVRHSPSENTSTPSERTLFAKRKYVSAK